MKQDQLSYTDPITGIWFMGIIPVGRVIAGSNPIPQELAPGYVKFVPTPPPRKPYAGKTR